MVLNVLKDSAVTKHMFRGLITVYSYNQYCSNLTIGLCINYVWSSNVIGPIYTFFFKMRLEQSGHKRTAETHPRLHQWPSYISRDFGTAYVTALERQRAPCTITLKRQTVFFFHSNHAPTTHFCIFSGVTVVVYTLVFNAVRMWSDHPRHILKPDVHRVIKSCTSVCVPGFVYSWLSTVLEMHCSLTVSRGQSDCEVSGRLPNVSRTNEATSLTVNSFSSSP